MFLHVNLCILIVITVLDKVFMSSCLIVIIAHGLMYLEYSCVCVYIYKLVFLKATCLQFLPSTIC